MLFAKKTGNRKLLLKNLDIDFKIFQNITFQNILLESTEAIFRKTNNLHWEIR